MMPKRPDRESVRLTKPDRGLAHGPVWPFEAVRGDDRCRSPGHRFEWTKLDVRIARHSPKPLFKIGGESL